MVVRSNKPHYHVTAGLLWRDGSVLITKRPEGSHLAGFWEFPGGKQESGETLEECLEREIKEELGIDVRAQNLLFTAEHEYESRIVSLYLFLCTHLGGELEPLECDEIRWVHPEDLTQYRFPPPDLKIIQFLQKWEPSDDRGQIK
ncbi:MAG: 8-oxo-dGTP diphosphatase MutT [Deltaproteobacteria bacterium]|nr:MAG: 8-oxo-dGTP diphosphatase MutT [Deltaproteobacteria bacterium]